MEGKQNRKQAKPGHWKEFSPRPPYFGLAGSGGGGGRAGLLCSVVWLLPVPSFCLAPPARCVPARCARVRPPSVLSGQELSVPQSGEDREGLASKHPPPQPAPPGSLPAGSQSCSAEEESALPLPPFSQSP